MRLGFSNDGSRDSGPPSVVGNPAGNVLPDTVRFSCANPVVRDPLVRSLRFSPSKEHFAARRSVPAPFAAAPVTETEVRGKSNAGHRNRPRPFWMPKLVPARPEPSVAGLKQWSCKGLGDVRPRALSVCNRRLLAAPKGTAHVMEETKGETNMHHPSFPASFLALDRFQRSFARQSFTGLSAAITSRPEF